MSQRLELELREGRLHLLAASGAEALLDPCASWVRTADRHRAFASPLDLAGVQAWCKAEPFPAKAALRHALRARALRRPLPRARELENLEWLRARCFQTPRPWVAGALWRGGVPRWQFLITERIENACSLLEVLRSPSDERDACLRELAREVARLHSLRFVHRDLFARNFLVLPSTFARRLVFLDAWRGGARLQLRGVPYDLACLRLDLDAHLEPDAVAGWFEVYARERATQGRPIDREKLLSLVARESRSLRRRYRRRGRAAELAPSSLSP